MPLNRLTAFFSNRAVSRPENLNAVRCSSLSGKVASGQRSRAAAALRRSEPARQSHYGPIAGALFRARGGCAERLARPRRSLGYMPAIADRRLPPGNRCRRCCAFLSAIVEDAINPFGVLERILYWWCSA